MNNQIFLFVFSLSLLIFSSCENSKTESIVNLENHTKSTNLLTDYLPLCPDGDVNAVVEIPSGTLDKWELNKLNGQIEWEFIDQKPRIINYLGYPGNYGMIPQTLLSKEKGGDGDPLDILVLGPPAERGSIVKCKIIGVLFLLDRGERDDKLIAVSDNSPLYNANDITDLQKNYNGISEIIKLWFTNYKGPNKMDSKGFGSKNVAEHLLKDAINEYKLNHTKAQQ
jgi:inorganic pyrophosphatase